VRIAVPRELLERDLGGGDGRMWREVLGRLAAAERVQPLEGRTRRRPDVVLASGHRPLPKRVPGPLVAQLHEAPWDDPAQATLFAPEFAGPMRARGLAAVAAAARLLTPSRSARDELVGALGADPARVDVVAQGVDAERFATAAEAAGATAAPVPGRYVLLAGTLHPRRNAGALRDAMAGLARRGIEAALVLAGPEAYDRAHAGAIEAEATAPLEGVRVVRVVAPPDDELAALMAGAAAFCLPSLSEGFGITVLEAMACGAPVVASDRGALPEVVGDAGLLVAPEAPALEDALARVLTDDALAADLRAAGRERAAAFTWKRTAEGWMATLEAAARG
jgi:glycosyltransferase involved in cell wall biosynthesis